MLHFPCNLCCRKVFPAPDQIRAWSLRSLQENCNSCRDSNKPDQTFIGLHGRLCIGRFAKACAFCSAPSVPFVGRGQNSRALHPLPCLAEIGRALRQCCPKAEAELLLAICLHAEVQTCMHKSGQLISNGHKLYVLSCCMFSGAI